MKLFCLGICSALTLLSSVQASTITIPNFSQLLDPFAASATYIVTSDGGGITSKGFTGSATSTGPEYTLTLDYGFLAGSTIQSATLDLSVLLNASAFQQPTPSISYINNDNGQHHPGTSPTFSPTPSLFVSIGDGSQTQTMTLTQTTNYNLLTFFAQDLEDGNTLTVKVSLTDLFQVVTPPSGSWKNTKATYSLNQDLSGNLSAASTVTYDAPTATPEPLPLVLSGAGLLGLGILRKKKASPKN